MEKKSISNKLGLKRKAQEINENEIEIEKDGFDFSRKINDVIS